MTTKKIIIIVVSVIVVLGLVVVLTAGGIIGFVLYSINNSEAATVSKDFLRKNERLKQDIGEVQDFGSVVTGSSTVSNGDGSAQLHFKVIGERKQVNATVELLYRNGNQWRVIAAFYHNEGGERIDLLDPYESRNAVLRLAA